MKQYPKTGVGRHNKGVKKGAAPTGPKKTAAPNGKKDGKGKQSYS